MDGYVRVSRVMGREGEGYISPTVQREAIQKWADYKGVEIVAWHVDEDQSGGTQNRPGIRAAIQRVQDGETDGIACWRINRFARNVSEAIEDVTTIHEAGGHLAFIEEDIDPTGPFGGFILTILLAVGELELNNLKASWRTAKTRAHERGAKIGPTPFGYRRQEDGTLTIHEGEAAMVQEAYARAGRDGTTSALTYLEGQTTPREGGKLDGQARTWTTSTVRRMLALRIYLGEMRWGNLPPGQFDELRIVDRATWEAAQHNEIQGRTPPRHYPLSGVATCGQCGERLVGGSAGKNQRTYRCRASLKSWKGARCNAPTNVTARLLEEHVRALLLEQFDGAGEWVQREASDGLADAEAVLLQSERELDDFIADTEGAALLRRVGRYEQAVGARVDAVEAARRTFKDAASSSAAGLTASPAELLAGDDPAGLAAVARGVLGGLVVRRGRGPLPPRVSLAPLPYAAEANPEPIMIDPSRSAPAMQTFLGRISAATGGRTYMPTGTKTVPPFDAAAVHALVRPAKSFVPHTTDCDDTVYVALDERVTWVVEVYA